MRKLSIIAGVIVALVTVVLLLLPASQARRPRDASLLFLGFTNVPTKGEHAIFWFTNGTPASIAWMEEAIECQTANGWVRTQLQGLVSSPIHTWIGLQSELGPGKAFTFLVPPPTTNGVWRLEFRCWERDRLRDTFGDVVQRVMSGNSGAAVHRRYSGRSYQLMTPEVAQ